MNNDNVFFLNLNSAFSFAPAEVNAVVKDLINYDTLPTILSIKIPAKVNNIENAIDLLGGLENIKLKNKKDDDINFKLLSIDLEKCVSYDYLLKKKRKRSKKNPTKVKYEYIIIGKIPYYYSYFSLCDFIYFKNNKIDPITYYRELALKESDDSDQDLINLIKKETISEKEIDSGFLDSFALNKYSIGRNKYQASINNILLSKLDFDSK